MLAFCILVLGVLSRVLLHIPNFTPVIAIALFSGVYFEKKQAIILPLILFALSDLIIGFHNTMFFTWGSMLLIVSIGFWLRQHKNVSMIFAASVGSAILFFLVSNLGVWMTGELYSRTLAGLTECFVMAVPFFKTTLLSTLIYTAIFFGSYEWIGSRIKGTAFARAL